MYFGLCVSRKIQSPTFCPLWLFRNAHRRASSNKSASLINSQSFRKSWTNFSQYVGFDVGADLQKSIIEFWNGSYELLHTQTCKYVKCYWESSRCGFHRRWGASCNEIASFINSHPLCRQDVDLDAGVIFQMFVHEFCTVAFQSPAQANLQSGHNAKQKYASGTESIRSVFNSFHTLSRR